MSDWNDLTDVGTRFVIVLIIIVLVAVAAASFAIGWWLS